MEGGTLSAQLADAALTRSDLRNFLTQRKVFYRLVRYLIDFPPNVGVFWDFRLAFCPVRSVFAARRRFEHGSGLSRLPPTQSKAYWAFLAEAPPLSLSGKAKRACSSAVRAGDS